MSTNPGTMNIDHRLNGGKLETLNSCLLADAVCLMVRRGQAVISLIQSELVNDGNKSSQTDLVHFDALESVSAELGDIDQLVAYFNRIQQQPQKEL